MSAGTLVTLREAQSATQTPRTPDVWAAAPFDAATAAEIRALAAKLDARQRSWLSGYLAGSLQLSGAPAPKATPASVLILHGSQSGNAERLASRVAERLALGHVPHRVLDMLDCRKQDLESAETLLVVVSTHGDGEPPDRALPLHELLHGRKPLRLSKTRYSVLALGDSSYEKFCETGRQFDARLEALGAKRLGTRVECDVDFESQAQEWIETVAAAVAADAATPAAAIADVIPLRAEPASAYTRKNPFRAAVLANQRFTARGSSKDVRHIELSLDGSGMHHEPGDSLGVVPRNAEHDVDALLAALGMPADEPVIAGAQALELRSALLEHYEIGTLSAAFARRYAAFSGNEELAMLATNEIELARYVHGRELLDLVRSHPPRGLDAEGFAKLLRPLAPRLYSIASSAAATPEEAHLTVGVVEYQALGRRRRGVVSGTLADLPEGDATSVYLHRNPSFRLPADAGQEHKVYVQHRLAEHGAELWAWLQDGAHLYVCGDATRMAPDVESVLRAIARRHGGLDDDDARAYLLDLQLFADLAPQARGDCRGRGPRRGADQHPHERLPERLLAALSRRDRAGRQGAGQHNLYLGASANGDRLNALYRETIGEEEIIAALAPLLARYAAERTRGERFGDFAVRAGIVSRTNAGKEFQRG